VAWQVFPILCWQNWCSRPIVDRCACPCSTGTSNCGNAQWAASNAHSRTAHCTCDLRWCTVSHLLLCKALQAMWLTSSAAAAVRSAVLQGAHTVHTGFLALMRALPAFFAPDAATAERLGSSGPQHRRILPNSQVSTPSCRGVHFLECYEWWALAAVMIWVTQTGCTCVQGQPANAGTQTDPDSHYWD
jgi:hypothetical protein